MAKYTVEMVDIDRLKAASFNPADRTEARYLSELMESVKSLGILQPIVATRDYVIADGHRRWTVAKELGYKQVPVHFEDKSVGELWSGNAGVRSVKPGTWLSAVDGGLDIDHVPNGHKAAIYKLMDLLGPDEFHELAKKRLSPSIYAEARKVARYLGELDDAWLRRIIIWLHVHRMRYIVRKLYEDDVPEDVIRKAIEKNRPIERHWSVA